MEHLFFVWPFLAYSQECGLAEYTEEAEEATEEWSHVNAGNEGIHQAARKNSREKASLRDHPELRWEEAARGALNTGWRSRRRLCCG